MALRSYLAALLTISCCQLRCVPFQPVLLLISFSVVKRESKCRLAFVRSAVPFCLRVCQSVRVPVCVNSVKTEFCVWKKKNQQRSVCKKKAKATTCNGQRSRCRGRRQISKSSKHWPQLKVTVTVAVAPCRGVGSRRLSVVGVLVAAVLTLLLFYFVG